MMMQNIREQVNRIAISTIVIIMLIFSILAGFFVEFDREKTPDRNSDFPLDKTSEIQRSLSSMPGWFTENQGQIENPEVRFVYASSGCSIGFLESGYLLKLTGEDNLSSMVEVRFEGANPVLPEGKEELPHKSNYFIGDDSSKWRTNVANYEKIYYRNLYDGIDLFFYTTGEGLKYDFLVSPGATPEEIRYSYDGVDDIFVDGDGNLHIISQTGDLVEEAPYSYQTSEGKRVAVMSNYWIDGNTVKYKLGSYDSSCALVIDPLIYSTFVGGSGSDRGCAIALDPENNAYITGTTKSTDFPTTPGCYNDTYGGGPDFGEGDVFVCKLGDDGSTLLYSTYVGGENGDIGFNIALDSDYNAYVTGYTGSSSFPTTEGSYDESHSGSYDVFVFKLNADGSELLFSTLVGDDDREIGYGIALDPEWNVYVGGFTDSSDFPTTPGCFDGTFGGDRDAFVLKLKSDGSELIYSTFVGGDDDSSSTDMIRDIAIDSGDNVYATGSTESTDFPTTPGCYDDEIYGDKDAFVFKINPDGSDLTYSTFVGGKDSESGYSIVLDSSDNAYVTGGTWSSDFPTTSECFDDSHGGRWDVFVFELNTDGTDLSYSTLVGGDSDEEGKDIAIDADNNVYVTGSTGSMNFSTTEGCYDDSFNDGGDVFVFKLNSDGSALINSTFFGGEGGEAGASIAIDSDNATYITGNAYDQSFPTTSGCYEDEHKGSNEIFVFRLSSHQPEAIIESIIPEVPLDTDDIIFTGKDSDEDGSIVQYVWRSDVNGQFHSGPERQFTYSGLSNGTHQIYLKVLDNDGKWSFESSPMTIEINGAPIARIESISPSPATDTENIRFKSDATDDGTITKYAWRSDLTEEFYNGTSKNIFKKLPSGTHTIYHKVCDNQDAWGEETSTTLVVKNMPKIVSVYRSNPPYFHGENIHFSCEATDDGVIGKYVWESSSDGEFYNGSNAEFDYDGLSPDSHVIVVKAQDDEGFWSEEEAFVIRVYAKPIAAIESISPGTVLEGENITFSGSGTDEDGDIVAYSWRSSLDGELYNGTNTSFTLDNLSIGNHTIYLKVQDDDEYWGEEDSVALTVKEIPPPNTPPEISVTSPDNNTEVSGIVTLSGTASDDDGDGTIQKIEISINDGEWQTATGTTSWNFQWDTFTLENGTYSLEFRAFDGMKYSDIVYLTLAVQNTAGNSIPTVIITSPTNNTIVTGAVIISGAAHDDDGDGTIQKVEVSINGENWISAIGTSSWNFEWDSTKVENGTYEISVRAYDGEDYSDVALWKLTVENQGDTPTDDDDDDTFTIAGMDGVMVIGGGVGAVVVVVMAALMMKRKGGKDDAEDSWKKEEMATENKPQIESSVPAQTPPQQPTPVQQLTQQQTTQQQTTSQQTTPSFQQVPQQPVAPQQQPQQVYPQQQQQVPIQVAAPQQAAAWQCAKCGSTMEANYKFCTGCGTKRDG